MQTLIKTLVLTALVSFIAPATIGAAAEVTASADSIGSAKTRPHATSRKKRHKPAAKRDTKKPEKVSAHEL
jgi:hypothetical protein